MINVNVDKEQYHGFIKKINALNNEIINTLQRINNLNSNYDDIYENNVSSLNFINKTLKLNNKNILLNDGNKVIKSGSEKIEKASNMLLKSIEVYEEVDEEGYHDLQLLINNLFDEKKNENDDIYLEKKEFIKRNNVKNFLHNFDYLKFGINKDTLEQELFYVYKKRGIEEFNYLTNGLLYNVPKNYYDHHFQPVPQLEDNSYYDYNEDVISNYATNSEIININGVEFDIAQVLPKDCTSIEMLAYNFCKVNVINTLKTLPEEFLKTIAESSNKAIVLTCDIKAMNHDDLVNWSGYYSPQNSLSFSDNGNMVVIDAHGSLYANYYYTQDVVIHELSHKYDDMLYEGFLKNTSLGGYFHSKNSDEWESLYQDYGNILPSIVYSGYTKYPNVSEFFGDAMVAYFKNGYELEKLCPRLYQNINDLLGKDYSNNYNVRIKEILSN